MGRLRQGGAARAHDARRGLVQGAGGRRLSRSTQPVDRAGAKSWDHLFEHLGARSTGKFAGRRGRALTSGPQSRAPGGRPGRPRTRRSRRREQQVEAAPRPCGPPHRLGTGPLGRLLGQREEDRQLRLVVELTVRTVSGSAPGPASSSSSWRKPRSVLQNRGGSRISELVLAARSGGAVRRGFRRAGFLRRTPQTPSRR